MNAFSHVPPGFRFHPTDEELVDYYLRKKVTSRRIDLDVIKDVDLYRIEPWDLQELCKLGGNEEQNEWFFFSHKDKKYPTGTRTNRATTAGFWKATGRDKAIYSKHDLIGMRKTLVFYKGRAPNGQKSDYIMHEYRLETDEIGAHQEEGWVVCRVFKKRITTMRKIGEHDSPMWYDDQVSFMPDHMESPKLQPSQSSLNYQYPYSCKKELHIPPYHIPSDHFLQLPFLETTKALQSPPTSMPFSAIPGFGLNINRAGSPLPASIFALEHMHQTHHQNMLAAAVCANNDDVQAADPVTDWRVLDKFVASQLSQADVPKDNDYSNAENSFHATDHDDQNMIARHLENDEMATETASTPSSSCQIDMWK